MGRESYWKKSDARGRIYIHHSFQFRLVLKNDYWLLYRFALGKRTQISRSKGVAGRPPMEWANDIIRHIESFGGHQGVQ